MFDVSMAIIKSLEILVASKIAHFLLFLVLTNDDYSSFT